MSAQAVLGTIGWLLFLAWPLVLLLVAKAVTAFVRPRQRTPQREQHDDLDDFVLMQAELEDYYRQRG